MVGQDVAFDLFRTATAPTSVGKTLKITYRFEMLLFLIGWEFFWKGSQNCFFCRKPVRTLKKIPYPGTIFP